MEELLRRGADVAYSDPHVERVEIGTRVFQSVPMTAETLATSDGAVIVTDHSAFDYSFIVEHAPLVVDLRNATRDLGRRPNVVRL